MEYIMSFKFDYLYKMLKITSTGSKLKIMYVK